MVRRLSVMLIAAIAVAVMFACGGGSQSQPTTPTSVTTTTTTVTGPSDGVSVDTITGDWTADPITDPRALADFEAVAAARCGQIEFRVDRDTDSKTAIILFAATCARVRLRGQGKGVMAGDVLHWRLEGTATRPDGGTCPFRFVEGNTAQPVGDGRIKVTYNGLVCGMPVAGTEIIRRK